MKDLPDEKQRELENAFTEASSEWRRMADGEECNGPVGPEGPGSGWGGPEGPGTVTNCGTMCGFISDGVGGFAGTMNTFAQYVGDNFGTCKLSATIVSCITYTITYIKYFINIIILRYP